MNTTSLSSNVKEPDLTPLLAGVNILVTGAAGTLGAELCRRIIDYHPRVVVGLDRSEQDLALLADELQTRHPEVHFVAQIGDIADQDGLTELMRRYDIRRVYHLAGFKHLPLLERNVTEAIRNNALGSASLADAAEVAGVEEFFFISSDKASRPTSVLGAASRITELLLLPGPDDERPRCRRAAMRLVNVRGGRGAVESIFEQQIRAGGPVLVTDAGMKRRFLDPTEAIDLFLQASSLASGGDIFGVDDVPETGILALAERMVHAAGVKGQPVEIRFSAPRAGEKLSEDAAVPAAGSQSVTPRLRRMAGSDLSPIQRAFFREELARLCDQHNLPGLLCKMTEIVPDYTPSEPLVRAATRECTDESLELSLGRLAAAVQVAAGAKPSKATEPVTVL